MPSPIQSNRRRGMSLLEVILAIAVAGMVLAAAVSFVASISSIWMERESRNFFEDHADGVAEFLSASLATAGSEIALQAETDTDSEAGADEGEGGSSDPSEESRLTVTPGTQGPDESDSGGTSSSDRSSGGLIRAASEPIKWERPPGASEAEPPRLGFQMGKAPPLLQSAGLSPDVGIVAFLDFEPGRGLSLLWYSALDETVEDERDLRRTGVSRLVSAMAFVYWDDRFERWETEDRAREGEDDTFILPRFVKLTFEYEGETQERTITVPVPSLNAVLF